MRLKNIRVLSKIRIFRGFKYLPFVITLELGYYQVTFGYVAAKFFGKSQSYQMPIITSPSPKIGDISMTLLNKASLN